MIAIAQIVAAGLTAISAVHALPPPQAAPSPNPAPTNGDSKLLIDLLTAPTALKRFQRLLVQDGSLFTGEELRKNTIFSFNGATTNPGAKGGATKSADIESFPILTGFDISTTLGFLEPCGINIPHVHPRATEFLTLVEGSDLKFGYILENGLVKAGSNREIAGYLNKFEGTVFPQGSIHFQFNDSCEKATFVATLDSNNPGTSQVAQGFYSLNAGVVNATLGFPKQIDGQNIEDFREYIPANLAQDVDVCLAKCKKMN
ncbi:RmlC-like cupin [Setomelanomma holmii]|uniref:RmlC-like cupin n=1 Tax=Setomelanomma holmii TaxID=210430 RepID=A0A9P4HI00_9PLEO|nr:RmlC-like cupin [Setomelanomma holmii]